MPLALEDPQYAFVEANPTDWLLTITAQQAAFADLDLSSVTGKRRCLVTMMISQKSAPFIELRANGVTADQQTVSRPAQGSSDPLRRYRLLFTDSQGVIEYRTGASFGGSGYIKLAVVDYIALNG